MTIVPSDENDDVPLDALLQKSEEKSSENKNNNGNKQESVIETVELNSSDSESESSSSTKGLKYFHAYFKCKISKDL
jgi:U3 small nucleolar RNA-associated protein 14